mgnify:CR=1 FL=1
MLHNVSSIYQVAGECKLMAESVEQQVKNELSYMRLIRVGG